MPSAKISAITGSTAQPLARRQIPPAAPSFRQRPAEDPLQNRQQKNRRQQQAEGRNRRRPPRQRQDSLEDEEFAGKPVQSRQAQRGQEGDAHQPAKNRRGPAQPAEIVQPAQPAAALLDQADEIKEGGGGQAVVEHLQDHAVERRRLVRSSPPRRGRPVAPRQKYPACSSPGG